MGGLSSTGAEQDIEEHIHTHLQIIKGKHTHSNPAHIVDTVSLSGAFRCASPSSLHCAYIVTSQSFADVVQLPALHTNKVPENRFNLHM